MINPHEVKIGDVLILDPDYDRRIGTPRLEVYGVCHFGTQSGISFLVKVHKHGAEWLDASWFTERAA